MKEVYLKILQEITWILIALWCALFVSCFGKTSSTLPILFGLWEKKYLIVLNYNYQDKYRLKETNMYNQQILQGIINLKSILNH